MSEDINEQLRDHATGRDDWEHAQQLQVLHEWADRFNSEFKLEIVTPAIRIERVRAIGAYRRGRNSFGLRHEITFNPAYSSSTW